MRRFLTLAIVAALGAWALKRLAEVGNDNARYEGMPQFSGEEEDLQSQTVEDLGDEVTPSPSGGEIYLESQPVDSVVDEAPPSSDDEIDLQSQIVDDLGDEVAPSSSDEELHLESQPVDSVVHEAPPPPDEDEYLKSQTVDVFRDDSIPLPLEEEVYLESQPAEPSASDGVEIQGPPDPDQWPKAGDDWSLPVGPNGEEKLGQTRAGVHDRFRNLLHRHKRDDETAA